MKIRYFLATLAVFTAPVQAQEIGSFDPRDPCVKVLGESDTVEQMMVAAWAFGYLAGKQGTVRPVHLENNKAVLQNITKACIERSGASLLELLDNSRKSSGAGSEAEARSVLMKFYEPGADLAALTWALKPSEADIRAVYADPLASKLVEMYAGMYTPGVAIGPKADHNDLIVVHTTTSQLREGKPVLRDFPGGYKKVVSQLLGDFPIVRFKFVTKGETLGLAFDGLIFVGDRWVLMPKPWRALDGG